MKKLISIILCIAMLCALVACDAKEEAPVAAEAPEAEVPAAEGKTKITILRPGDQQKVAAFLEPAIAEFEAQNPDIDVEIKYDSWAGWLQTYPTYFEADTQPDVIFWNDNKLHDSSAAPKLIDLTPYLDPEVKEKIPQAVWDLVDPGDIGDAIYYVPSSVDPFVIYYNYDVFEAAGLDPQSPPTTWEELLSYAQQITEKTGLPGIGVPAFVGAEVLSDFCSLFINQSMKANVLTVESQANFGNDAGLEAFEYLEELFQYSQESPMEYGRGELRALVRDGQVGMIIDGPWAVPVFTAAWGENFTVDGKVGVAPVAQYSKGEAITFVNTNGWIATRESTIDASAKLINFMMSDEVLAAHHLGYGNPPLYEYELGLEAFDYPYWDTFYEEATEYTMFGLIGRNSPTPSAYYIALEEVYSQLLLGQISAEEAQAAGIEAAAAVTARNE